MSTSTERSSSHSDTQMGGTQQLNDHIFLHNMPMTERNDLCYLLDQNSLWIDLAQQMGYSKKDIDVSFPIDSMNILIIHRFIFS